MTQSPFTLATELKSYLDGLLSKYDLDSLLPAERTALVQVKHLAIDARLEARDYDYADSRVEQQQAAADARKYFVQLEQALLDASQYNLFGSVEIAQLSAQIQHIMTLMT